MKSSEMVKEIELIFADNDRNKIDRILSDEKYLEIIIQNDLFFKNFHLFANKINCGQILNFVYYICKHNKEYFITKKYEFLKCSDDDFFFLMYFDLCNKERLDLEDLINYLDVNKIKKDYDNVLKVVIMYNNKNKILEKHLNYLCSSKNYLKIRKMLIEASVDKKYIDILNEKINSNINEVIEEMVDQKLDVEVLKEEKILPFLQIILGELLTHENKKMQDIIILEGGAYSSVFEIGNKVLKIGLPRYSFKMKNNKRFLSPLYRQYIYSKDNEKILFCIEITEKVQTENITMEDAYLIFKELIEQDLYWIDCTPWNIGRLIRDNNIYFDNINYVDKNSTNYLTEMDEILKAGELIILDNDLILEKERFDKLVLKDSNLTKKFPWFAEFKERYDEEKIKIKK